MKIKITQNIPGYSAGEIDTTNENGHIQRYGHRYVAARLVERGWAEEIKQSAFEMKCEEITDNLVKKAYDQGGVKNTLYSDIALWVYDEIRGHHTEWVTLMNKMEKIKACPDVIAHQVEILMKRHAEDSGILKK